MYGLLRKITYGNSEETIPLKVAPLRVSISTPIPPRKRSYLVGFLSSKLLLSGSDRIVDCLTLTRKVTLKMQPNSNPRTEKVEGLSSELTLHINLWMQASKLGESSLRSLSGV